MECSQVITIFDHRGCTSHSNKEYKGEVAKRDDKKIKYEGEDEMLVKLKAERIAPNENFAAAVLRETVSIIAMQ
jgi:hypothetical protein